MHIICKLNNVVIQKYNVNCKLYEHVFLLLFEPTELKNTSCKPILVSGLKILSRCLIIRCGNFVITLKLSESCAQTT